MAGQTRHGAKKSAAGPGSKKGAKNGAFNGSGHGRATPRGRPGCRATAAVAAWLARILADLEPVMTRLADRFTLYAPDLRGFGDSDKPEGLFGPDQQAA